MAAALAAAAVIAAGVSRPGQHVRMVPKVSRASYMSRAVGFPASARPRLIMPSSSASSQKVDALSESGSWEKGQR